MNEGLLLAIDGDSLAHRAYHALPKSIRFNALVGFANFLMRLWEAEQPESVLVAWDSLETPTYRHKALPAYQSGREFEPSILQQLGMLPALVESFGFAVAKAGGYEADDFLAAASRAWTGPVLVATSDRDAFQLVNDHVTILQPVKGVSEIARIGITEVRERYGVEPEQVPDFIALRGDPSDKIPGAPGVGPKKAADVLKQHGSLAQALADGRFPQIADDLRPLPRHRDDGRQGTAAEARDDAAGLEARSRTCLGARAGQPRWTSRVARMNEWLERVTTELGIDADPDGRRRRRAPEDRAHRRAHERRPANAPLLTYLVGRSRRDRRSRSSRPCNGPRKPQRVRPPPSDGRTSGIAATHRRAARPASRSPSARRRPRPISFAATRPSSSSR